MFLTAVALFSAKVSAVSFQDLKTKCNNNKMLFYDTYKSKKYAEAYEPWEFVFDNCSKDLSHKSVFAYGPKVVRSKIKKEKDPAKKKMLAAKLVSIYDKRIEFFPEPAKHDVFKADQAVEKMSYKVGEIKEVFATLDGIFKKNQKAMNAKHLFAYFQAGIKMRKAEGFGGDARVFDIYDNVLGAIETNILDLTAKSNALHAKETRTKKEEKKMKSSDKYLKNFQKFEKNINKMIAPLATCERLEAIFFNGFKDKKNQTDEKWLGRAVTMMSRKKCYNEPTYLTVAEAYYKIKPKAKSARAIARLAFKKDKDMKKAYKYFKEASEMETDPTKKSSDLLTLAQVELAQGKKSSARKTALQAAKLRANWGEPYMVIGDAYATSANECGKTEFEKKAVYWAAVEKYKHAARIDRSVAKKALKKADSYAKLAPGKTMIFQQSKGRTSLKITCWVNETVQIPKI